MKYYIYALIGALGMAVGIGGLVCIPVAIITSTAPLVGVGLMAMIAGLAIVLAVVSLGGE